MPPPRPLQPHQRGFRRSRALWERRDPSWTYYTSRAFRSALLYELQPFRLAARTGSSSASLQQQLQATVHSLQRQIQETCRCFYTTSRCILTDYLGPFLRQHCTLTDAAIGVGLLLYLYTVRWIHAVLEAGPIVVIVTALVVVWTVGLSDNTNNDSMPSAYAVFNKGFQKLLGSVDADALLQQHVGGGMMMAAGGMMMGGGAAAGREQHHEHHRRRQPAVGNEEEEEEDDDDGGLLRRRRPRKKQGNRERNQQRRELQRQRQAAAEHGFGGHEEERAMLQLVEDVANL